MAEKLTKGSLKKEVSRRIKYYKDAFKFTPGTGNAEFEGKSHRLAIAFGQYRVYLAILWQIENNLFIGGYTA